MILKILLVISILLQLAAASIAIKLTRVTKYNSSWVLITIALTLMTLLRVGEFSQLFLGKDLKLPPDVFVWIGVVTSLCFAVGVFLIQKILSHISKLEQQRRVTEQRILNTTIQAEERERTRFSKDIHDGLGPLLSSAKMSISALSLMEMNQHQKEIIDNTNLVIDEAIKSLKEISNNISPHILNNFGLERAINNFIKKLNDITDININFTSNIKNRRFNGNIEVVIYRVVCEMINNSLKHSEASQIKISLTIANDCLDLVCIDNGKGFIIEEINQRESGGMGLSNMVSRIESLKGAIDISSMPGRGTRIVIKVATR